MQQTCERVEKDVTTAISNLFPKERICCLLRYGPLKTSNGQPPADFDFLLLLDEFDSQDYLRVRTIKEHNLPIEIFIDYKVHILLRGLENYRHGCHGAYFVYILASAKTLLGTNFFANKVHLIPLRKVKADLIDRIEEYFYRIQKITLNAGTEHDNHMLVKYVARILTDLLLLNDDIGFTDMHKYHYSSIIESKLSDSELFSTGDITEIQKLFSVSSPSVEQITFTVAILNNIFEQLIKTYHA